jgi:hypothetical protein
LTIKDVTPIAQFVVTPAETRVQKFLKRLDSGFRWNEKIRLKMSFSAIGKEHFPCPGLPGFL